MSKVRKFQLDTLSHFGMVEEKQEGGVFCSPPPPGKIGLKSDQTNLHSLAALISLKGLVGLVFLLHDIVCLPYF